MQTTSIRQQGLNALYLFLSLFPTLSLLYFFVPFGLLGTKLYVQSQDRQNQIRNIFILILFVEILCIALPGRYYARYLLQALPALLIIAGFGIERLISSLEANSSTVRDFISIGTGLAILVAIISQLPRALHWIDDRILTYTPTRSELIADYLEEVSEETDVVFAWGDPRVPFVANRPSQKWINSEPFFTSKEFVSQELIMEMIAEFHEHPPRFFIESPARTSLENSYLAQTMVEEYIQMNYRFITTIGDAELFEFIGN
jgi:4-amino-4-deoxy-L-arabinose transferase-like glycosyltransferase